MRVYVDVVEGGHGNANLEFTGQISRAVQRLNFGLGIFIVERHLFAIKPDLVVGTGFGQEIVGQRLRPLGNVGMCGR